ncbi:hypothetical protein [Aliikangiella maris]|uniref:Uncharacterized protein n=2 Tax=Aliikangiella maris TaxID=3162458 RepID=A0ABV2BUN9_9GAMM
MKISLEIDTLINLRLNAFIKKNLPDQNIELVVLPINRLKRLVFDNVDSANSYCTVASKGYESNIPHLETIPYLAFNIEPGLVTSINSKALQRHLLEDGSVNINSALADERLRWVLVENFALFAPDAKKVENSKLIENSERFHILSHNDPYKASFKLVAANRFDVTYTTVNGMHLFAKPLGVYEQLTFYPIKKYTEEYAKNPVLDTIHCNLSETSQYILPYLNELLYQVRGREEFIKYLLTFRDLKNLQDFSLSKNLDALRAGIYDEPSTLSNRVKLPIKKEFIYPPIEQYIEQLYLTEVKDKK